MYNPFKNKLPNFDEAQKAKRADKYRDSAELAEKGLSSGYAFRDYINERTTSLAGYKDLKTPKGDSVEEKMKALDDADPVKKDFADAMKVLPATANARADFGKEMIALNKLIQAKPPVYDMSSVAAVLTDLRANINTAIKAQHAEEKKRVSDLFDNNADFKKDLEKSLGIDPSQTDVFKKQTLDALDKTQAEELNKVNQVIENEVNTLHANAQKERDRIQYLALMYRNNKDEMDKRAAALSHPGAATQTSISTEYDPDKRLGTFKGMHPKDFKTLKSVTGADITQPEPGTFTVNFSKTNNFNFDSIGSLGGLTTTSKADLVNIAEGVRASGYDQITTNIKFPMDQDRAMELGRQAYEAALIAGFNPVAAEDPKDPTKTIPYITITVNGEEKKPEELFANQQDRLTQAKSKYTTDMQERENYGKASVAQNTTKLRNALAKERANATPAPAPTGTSPTI